MKALSLFTTMKRVCLAAAFVALLATGFTSCDKQENPVDERVAYMASTPKISWFSFDAESEMTGFEGAMNAFWESPLFPMGVFIITHPDSTSIGVIAYNNPTAEVFRNRIETVKEHPTKEPIVTTTNDSVAFKQWQARMEDAGYIVVSFKAPDGYYWGFAYTREEWNELYGPHN